MQSWITFLLLVTAAAPLVGQVRIRDAQTTLAPGTPIKTGALPTRQFPSSAPSISVGPSSPYLLSIQWTAIAGANSYRLYHATASDGPWAQFATVPGTTTQVEDQGLVPGTTFFYQVLAYSDPAATAQLTGITGSGQTAGVSPLVVSARCSPGGSDHGVQLQDCSWTWQPLPQAVAYRVGVEASAPYQWLSCSGGVIATVADTQYFRRDVYPASATTYTCGRTYTFRAIYPSRAPVPPRLP